MKYLLFLLLLSFQVKGQWTEIKPVEMPMPIMPKLYVNEQTKEAVLTTRPDTLKNNRIHAHAKFTSKEKRVVVVVGKNGYLTYDDSTGVLGYSRPGTVEPQSGDYYGAGLTISKLVSLYDEYKKECYADSSLVIEPAHTEKCPRDKGDYRLYYCTVDVPEKKYYRHVHPDFNSFMEYIRKKQ